MLKLKQQANYLRKLNLKNKCALVSITGFPNAGKSTLINSFIEKKISIVSHKVQTTQQSIRGILNKGKVQIIFIDTPGVVESRRHFSKSFSRAITQNEFICDFNLFILDVTKQLDEKEYFLIKKLTNLFKNNFLILNKIDLVEKRKLLNLSQKINSQYDFKNTFMISAKKKMGLRTLLNKIVTTAPIRKWIYTEEKTLTDKSLIFQISEITREKIFQLINKEIPYTVDIKTSIKEEKKIYIINQKIFVKKDSHKSIIIGKQGEKIKQIGTRSRLDIEKLIGQQVYLKIEVFKKKKNL
jgi:GTP-binding protein Era